MVSEQLDDAKVCEMEVARHFCAHGGRRFCNCRGKLDAARFDICDNEKVCIKLVANGMVYSSGTNVSDFVNPGCLLQPPRQSQDVVGDGSLVP